MIHGCHVGLPNEMVVHMVRGYCNYAGPFRGSIGLQRKILALLALVAQKCMFGRRQLLEDV